MYRTSIVSMIISGILLATFGCEESSTDGKDEQSVETGNQDSGVDIRIQDGSTDTIPIQNNSTDTILQKNCDAVSNITVGVLEKEIGLEGQIVTKTVQTVLMVKWDQTVAAETVKIRFTFENDEWFESPAEPGTEGSHEIPVFGVPELTDVTIQIVGETGSNQTVCETSGTTGKLPGSIPQATITEFNPSLASSSRWMLGTVEKTPHLMGTYGGVFNIYIIDRQGRIVWYYLDQAWSPITAYPRIARDGTYFYFDRTTYLGTEENRSPSIARTTLDFRQFEQIDAPSMTDSMDITDDGGFVYNSGEWLIELTADRTERQVWSCFDWVQDVGFDVEWTKAKKAFLENHMKGHKLGHKKGSWKDADLCYANSVVWNPLGDSILLSMPYINTVVEVSRQSGEIVGQWGDAAGSWQFEPASLGLDFVHGANITPDSTLLVSTHKPGDWVDTDGRLIKPPHYFIEFELDRTNHIAKDIWRYGEGLTDFPAAKGEVFPIPGGNRLVNYGTQGVIREVTPNQEVAWNIKWDAEFEVPPEVRKKFGPSYTEDDINNMVGHSILIDDLYALNQGWQ